MKVLMKTDKFIKIAFFIEETDTKNYIVVAGTKENVDAKSLELIAKTLIDFEVVKAEFNLYNLFISEKQIKLANTLQQAQTK